MKRVLVAPLDWGLGHATRCIPLIRELLQRQCVVFVAGSGPSLELLKQEFPALTFFSITGYMPHYPSKGSMVFSMASQLPKFYRTINNEHREVEKIIDEYRIEYIISDNRYGCWTKKIPSVFITHQSNILMPERFGWLSSIVKRMNEEFMRKFSVCWVPDFPDGGLSGELLAFGKTNHDIAVEFIGSLSRFKPLADSEMKYDVAAIFSGPEPQRTVFEKLVTQPLEVSGLKYFVVRGIPGSSEVRNNVADFMGTAELQQLLCETQLVIARSGYSTIMDMAALGKKAIFIPTPGQTEQEYLAKTLKERKIAFSMKQSEFNLERALTESKDYRGFVIRPSDLRLLGNAIDKLIHA
jgi:uncharacterized protein (TIGR00661 family)